MKSLYKSLTAWLLCLVFVFSNFIVSFADVNSLMIGSSSNALMTLELDDSDYSIMPMSSIGTVTNTINPNYINFDIVYRSADNSLVTISIVPEYSSGRFHVKKLNIPGPVVRIVPKLYSGSLPSAGSYFFGLDISSSFSMTYKTFNLYATKTKQNVLFQDKNQAVNTYQQSSGDLYLNNYGLQLTNIGYFAIMLGVDESENIRNVDISFAIQFKSTSSSSEYPVFVGSAYGQSDYEADVSSSLSDLSSSVDTMTDEISGVTEAIQNLQGAMEPHYSNVLTQLHHITEQLHAFYDQVYNNIHLPELSMLTQIKEAIENIDLQIEVDISEVKTAINNMSTAVQNKLQSTTDQITGGYDNSGMTSDKSELDGVLNQYEQAEEDLFDDAKGNINDFEFDTPLDQFTGPLSDVSYFLSGLFEAMGPMNVIITFSLTLTIAMVMIGWYRFKGGR